jgi:hypothetical protein
VKISDIHEGDTVIVRGSFGCDPPTSAIVTGVEECIKNGRPGNGNFLSVIETLQTDHGPDAGNIWVCVECGTQAKVES